MDCVLDYIITSRHIHLLAPDSEQARDTCWNSSIALGSEAYIKEVKATFGDKVKPKSATSFPLSAPEPLKIPRHWLSQPSDYLRGHVRQSVDRLVR